MLGFLFRIVAYIINGCITIHSTASTRTPSVPFSGVCIAFFLQGVGLSLINAHVNGFMSMLQNSTEMGLAHASYGTLSVERLRVILIVVGVGALVAPLISTQFSQITYWSFHYFILVGVSVVDLVTVACVFKGKEYDGN